MVDGRSAKKGWSGVAAASATAMSPEVAVAASATAMSLEVVAAMGGHGGPSAVEDKTLVLTGVVLGGQSAAARRERGLSA